MRAENALESIFLVSLGLIQIYYCILTKLNDLVQKYKNGFASKHASTSVIRNKNGVKCIYVLEIPVRGAKEKLLLFEGILWALFFPLDFEGKIH